MCLVLCSAAEVQPFPLTRVPGQTHLWIEGSVFVSLQALHEEHTGAPVERAEGGRRVNGHEVKAATGNKAGILFSLLARAIIKFTTPVKAQGSLPCQQSQQSCFIPLRCQLLSHKDLSAGITHRGVWRGLSCNNSSSKSTLLKVSVHSTRLGRGTDSFSPF